MKNDLCLQLNEFAASFGVSDRVRFYDGNALNAVTSVAPFSRVAVLYSARSFEDFGKDFSANLKRAGVKPLNFIMPTSVTVRLNDVLDVIGVPEDVRAILCFDRALLPIAAYLATVFNIPVVFNLRSACAEEIIPAKVSFAFGVAGAETVAVNCAYHVAVDFDNLSDEDVAEGYLSLLSKRVALFDYRVKMKLLSKRIKKTLCDATEEVLNAVKPPVTARDVAFYGLKAEILSLAFGGEPIYNSAYHCFKRLTGFAEDKGQNFALLQKLAALYRLAAENPDMPFAIPDYNARTKSLSALTGLDDGKFLRWFYDQKKALQSADLSLLKGAVKKELAALSSEIDKAKEIYLSLGGKECEDFSPYTDALRYCGDLPDAINFMTVVREGGFLETD